MNQRRYEVDISCIIPVYDSEKYIEMAISSLCQQTKKNIEIICVDDASQDQSLAILERLAFEDSRIRIVKNALREGAALSRNKGLKEARGKYVIFLDSDDYFYPNMLEVSYGLASEHDADLVIFGYEQVCMEIEAGKEKEGKVSFKKNRFNIYLEDICDREYLEIIETVPWNKLVKREFLLQQGIEFQDIPSNNDVFYSMAVGILAKKTVVCDKILMKYFWGRRGSLTKWRQNICVYRPMAWQYLTEFLLQKEFEYEKNKELYNLIVDSLIAFYRDSSNSPKCRRNTTELFYQCEKLIDLLIKVNQDEMLYLHASEFIKKVQNREMLWEIRYFEYFMPGIKWLVEKCQQENKKMALWGCGVIGAELLKGMSLNQVKVDYVIDSAESKIGTWMEGYLIEKYDEVKEQIDVILVTTPKHFEEIKSIAVGKQVIDLRIC